MLSRVLVLILPGDELKGTRTIILTFLSPLILPDQNKQPTNLAELEKKIVQENKRFSNTSELFDSAKAVYQQRSGVPLLDYWGRVYRLSGSVQKEKYQITLTSAGPDGVFGTSDDVIISKVVPVRDK